MKLFYYIWKCVRVLCLTYYQRNRDVILNRAKDYYENDKESVTEHGKK